METNSNKIPFNQLPSFEQTNRLTQMVQQAYFRRSRQLPANLADMVSVLKGDLLKYLGGIPADKLDLAITTATLDNDQPLSVAFFFAAAKKAWFEPKTNAHQWDSDGFCRSDLEGDTISLLDTLAGLLRQGKKLFFNPNREFAYLVMRHQLDTSAAERYIDAAKLSINKERTDDGQHRIDWSIVGRTADLVSRARQLAVEDWLRSCNTMGIAPSAILSPLANETEYSIFRKTL